MASRHDPKEDTMNQDWYYTPDEVESEEEINEREYWEERKWELKRESQND